MMWSYPSTHLKTFHPKGYGLLQRPETANLVQVLPDLDVLLGNWRARCHNWIQFENQTNSTPLKFTSYSRCIRLDIRLVVLEVAALAATTLEAPQPASGSKHCPFFVSQLREDTAHGSSWGEDTMLSLNLAAFRDTFTAGLLEIGVLEPPTLHIFGAIIGHHHLHGAHLFDIFCLYFWLFFFVGGAFLGIFFWLSVFFLLGTSKKNAYRFH